MKNRYTKIITGFILAFLLLYGTALSANRVVLSPEYFPNPVRSGSISSGSIYVGIVDLDPKIVGNQKQISVLQENGTTIPVAQPIETNAGGVAQYNGSPVTIFVDGAYSLRVDDKYGAQVYYVPSADPSGEISDIAAEIVNSFNFENIAELRSFQNTGSVVYERASVAGYYTAGDGGGGPDRAWKLGAGQIDDGAGIIVPGPGIGTVSTTGAWVWPDGTIESYLAYGGLVEAVTAIGSVSTKILIDVQPPALTADLIIPENITLDLVAPMTWSGSLGFTLTVNSVIQGGTFRVFDSDFTLRLPNAQTLKADWWGDRDSGRTSATLKRSFEAAFDGSTILMSGGIWDFGTVGADLTVAGTGKTVFIEGTGSGYTYAGIQGTHIIYTGTGAALTVADSTGITKLRVSGGGAYGIQFGSNVSPKPWVGVARDLNISGMSIAGIKAVAIQLGYMVNVVTTANTAGMEVITADNTLGYFVRCSFKQNIEQGVIYRSTGTDVAFRYMGCDFELNGKEAINSQNVALINQIIDGGWIERNYTSQPSGFFQVNMDNSGNLGNKIVNVQVREANGTNLFCTWDGELTIDTNRYTIGGIYYVYAGANTKLINRDSTVEIANVVFNGFQNYYLNMTGANHIMNLTANNDFIPRVHNVTVTNVGATGGPDFLVGPAINGLRWTAINSDAGSGGMTLTPFGGDQIVPGTDAVGDRYRTTDLYASVTLEAIDSTNIVIVSETGTWADVN